MRDCRPRVTARRAWFSLSKWRVGSASRTRPASWAAKRKRMLRIRWNDLARGSETRCVLGARFGPGEQDFRTAFDSSAGASRCPETWHEIRETKLPWNCERSALVEEIWAIFRKNRRSDIKQYIAKQCAICEVGRGGLGKNGGRAAMV